LMWHRIGVAALAILALWVGGSLLTAQEKADRPRAKGQDRLEVIAAKLGLSAEQKEKIRQIHDEFDSKRDKLEDQIRDLRQEERQAMSKVLTEEQRAKVPGVLKEEMEKGVLKEQLEKELGEIADRLGLSQEQRQRIQKIRREYRDRIEEAEEEKGGKAYARIRELLRAEFEAIRKELTENQRARLPGILREEFEEMRESGAMRQRLRVIADKLDLSEDQRKELKEIHGRYDQKVDRLADEIRELRREEREAVTQVFTEEQRAKAREMFQRRDGEQKRPRERDKDD